MAAEVKAEAQITADKPIAGPQLIEFILENDPNATARTFVNSTGEKQGRYINALKQLCRRGDLTKIVMACRIVEVLLKEHPQNTFLQVFIASDTNYSMSAHIAMLLKPDVAAELFTYLKTIQSDDPSNAALLFDALIKANPEVAQREVMAAEVSTDGVDNAQPAQEKDGRLQYIDTPQDTTSKLIDILNALGKHDVSLMTALLDQLIEADQTQAEKILRSPDFLLENKVALLMSYTESQPVASSAQSDNGDEGSDATLPSNDTQAPNQEKLARVVTMMTANIKQQPEVPHDETVQNGATASTAVTTSTTTTTTAEAGEAEEAAVASEQQTPATERDIIETFAAMATTLSADPNKTSYARQLLLVFQRTNPAIFTGIVSSHLFTVAAIANVLREDVTPTAGTTTQQELQAPLLEVLRQDFDKTMQVVKTLCDLNQTSNISLARDILMSTTALHHEPLLDNGAAEIAQVGAVETGAGAAADASRPLDASNARKITEARLTFEFNEYRKIITNIIGDDTLSKIVQRTRANANVAPAITHQLLGLIDNVTPDLIREIAGFTVEAHCDFLIAREQPIPLLTPHQRCTRAARLISQLTPKEKQQYILQTRADKSPQALISLFPDDAQGVFELTRAFVDRDDNASREEIWKRTVTLADAMLTPPLWRDTVDTAVCDSITRKIRCLLDYATTKQSAFNHARRLMSAIYQQDKSTNKVVSHHILLGLRLDEELGRVCRNIGMGHPESFLELKKFFLDQTEIKRETILAALNSAEDHQTIWEALQTFYTFDEQNILPIAIAENFCDIVNTWCKKRDEAEDKIKLLAEALIYRPSEEDSIKHGQSAQFFCALLANPLTEDIGRQMLEYVFNDDKDFDDKNKLASEMFSQVNLYEAFNQREDVDLAGQITEKRLEHLSNTAPEKKCVDNKMKEEAERRRLKRSSAGGPSGAFDAEGRRRRSLSTTNNAAVVSALVAHTTATNTATTATTTTTPTTAASAATTGT